MAYDFSNVSAITIPEGSVKKITDSSGNVLWQKVIVIENEPVQKGTLTYTGSELSPEWYYYDETMMTCTGGNVRTDAGTYLAVFKPNDGYCWSDGSVDYKTIRWTIGKAAGSVSISPTTLTLNSDATSGTITVTRAGDGAISAVSSDTSVATVSVSDNVVTVSSVDSTTGTATITISVAAGTNHTAPADVTCAVSAEFITYISAYPTVTSTVYYTGSTVSPTITNYNTAQVTIGGTTSATNEGTYTITFTPKTGFCWSDGSTSTYSRTWHVTKRNGTNYIRYNGGTSSDFSVSKETMETDGYFDVEITAKSPFSITSISDGFISDLSVYTTVTAEYWSYTIIGNTVRVSCSEEGLDESGYITIVNIHYASGNDLYSDGYLNIRIYYNQ